MPNPRAASVLPSLPALAAATLLLAAALPAAADALPAKPDKVVVCAACHGETGVSTIPTYPNLAGQYTNYLEHALHAYKSGERRNAIMSAQAANLTEQEIEDLAHWYAQQPKKLFTLERPGDPGR